MKIAVPESEAQRDLMKNWAINFRYNAASLRYSGMMNGVDPIFVKAMADSQAALADELEAAIAAYDEDHKEENRK